jgi:rare lipoprotein A
MMVRKTSFGGQTDGLRAARVVAAYAATHSGFRALSATSIAACLFFAAPTHAASINTEAGAPQRAQTAQTYRPSSGNIPRVSEKVSGAQVNDGVPDQNWGGRAGAPRASVAVSPTVSKPTTTARAMPVSRAPNAVRQVMVPVLGRELQSSPIVRAIPQVAPTRATPPAAPVSRPVQQSAARIIAITASEPVLDSIVRPQDVPSFQKIGAPYQIAGTWYVPAHEPDYDETGVASWYGSDFQGRPTANGEIFDMNVVTAAHPTLPIPSLVEVTNLANGRSIVVRVNDRGPFVSSRLIDLSARGAELLGYQREGHTNVRVRYVGPASADPMVTAQTLTPARQLASTSSQKPLPVSQAPQPTFAQAIPTVESQNGQAFVQVGAYSQRANAERVRDQAMDLGPVQVIEAAQPSGQILFRVVLGPVGSRTEAADKAAEMSGIGFAGARVLASLD